MVFSRFLHDIDIRFLYVLKVICPYADEPAAADDRPPVAGGAVGGGAAASSSAGPAKRRRMEIDEELGSGAAAGDESDPGNCPWQGSYGDLLSKHVAECPNWAVSCPRECGKTMPRRALKQHETVCTKLLTMCKICGEAMRPEELEAHRAANVERHAALLEVKCGELEQENAEIQRQNADLRRGQSSLLNSVAWCFDLVDIPLLETPRPRSLVSKSFYLSGVGPLVIAVVRKQESIFFALLHVGHCKEHLGGGLPPRHLEGGLPCEEEWGGTLRATLSDPLTGHQYETGTEIPVKIGPEKAQKRVPMFLKSRFPKFEQKSLKIQIQDFSVGPVIGNDGIKRLLRTPVM